MADRRDEAAAAFRDASAAGLDEAKLNPLELKNCKLVRTSLAQK